MLVLEITSLGASLSLKGELGQSCGARLEVKPTLRPTPSFTSQIRSFLPPVHQTQGPPVSGWRETEVSS